MKGVAVTCVDLETGASETKIVAEGDYVLTVVAPAKLIQTGVLEGGKLHVLTVEVGP